jgi:acylphosphatase
MGVVRIGPDGKVEVIVPSTPEEIVEAEAGLQKVIEALARLAAKQDWDAAQTEVDMS